MIKINSIIDIRYVDGDGRRSAAPNACWASKSRAACAMHNIRSFAHRSAALRKMTAARRAIDAKEGCGRFPAFECRRAHRLPPRHDRSYPAGASDGFGARDGASLRRDAWSARNNGAPVGRHDAFDASWRRKRCQEVAAVFSLDSARIFTRTLAGLAAAFTISPVAGLRTSVPALRAGTLRRLTFSRPGRTNSPTPLG